MAYLNDSLPMILKINSEDLEVYRDIWSLKIGADGVIYFLKLKHFESRYLKCNGNCFSFNFNNMSFFNLTAGLNSEKQPAKTYDWRFESYKYK